MSSWSTWPTEPGFWLVRGNAMERQNHPYLLPRQRIIGLTLYAQYRSSGFDFPYWGDIKFFMEELGCALEFLKPE